MIRYVLNFSRFLGNLYSGEALVMLDRAGEAIDHLNPTSITSLDVSEFGTYITVDVACIILKSTVTKQTRKRLSCA